MNAHNARFQDMKSMISHGNGFLKALGFVVYSSWPYGVYITPIRFWLWVHTWVAIHLRGGGNHETCALGFGQTKAIMDTQRTYFEGLDRNFEIIYRASGRSKVQNVMHLTRHMYKLTDVVVKKLKFRQSKKVLNVFEAAGDEVVHPNNMIAIFDKTVT